MSFSVQERIVVIVAVVAVAAVVAVVAADGAQARLMWVGYG